jgi:hypothetical protein
MLYVVCLKKFGTKAIWRWQTNSLPRRTSTMTLRHPMLDVALGVRRKE